jgi:hypothetical protein
MAKKSHPSQTLVKVVNDLFPVKKKRGGGLIKIEAWEDMSGKVARYSMTYINPLLFAGDNGRVLGYDNAHGYHHRPYKGSVSMVENFSNYENLLDRFQQELKEFIK